LKAFAKHPANETVTTVPTLPMTAQPLVEPLSETQLNILRLVAAGLSNRDIAARLAITEGTTKWHLNQVYGKLNVCSRTQAVAQARQRRLI
jgi:ATP/maltotriose-dependent transcriptional regulator MalT